MPKFCVARRVSTYIYTYIYVYIHLELVVPDDHHRAEECHDQHVVEEDHQSREDAKILRWGKVSERRVSIYVYIYIHTYVCVYIYVCLSVYTSIYLDK